MRFCGHGLLVMILCGLLIPFTGLAQQFSGSVEPADLSTTGPVMPAWVAPKVKPAEPARAEHLISGVPGYEWRHGCGPTAVGMIAGFLDATGFGGLIPGDASTQTESVNQAIASQGSELVPLHYEDYCLPLDDTQSTPLPDKSEPPAGDQHPNNCIADYMRCSWSARGNLYGYSRSYDQGAAWEGYVEQQLLGYRGVYSAWRGPRILTWTDFTGEIDADHPVLLLVDTDGDAVTDHFVTAVGYRETTRAQEYGCLDTWAPASEVRWCEFRGLASGVTWGIYAAWSFGIVQADPQAMKIDDGSMEATLGMTEGGVSYQFLWFTRFAPKSDEFPFVIDSVEAMFGDTGVAEGDAMELVIYRDSTPGDPSDAVYVTSRDVEVQYNTRIAWNRYELTPPVTIEGPGEILVGFINRHVESGVSPESFAAVVDRDSDAQRSYVAAWTTDPPDPPVLPPDDMLLTTADIGFAGNWMIRAFGHAGSGPTPTPTPECETLGCTIDMPSDDFTAGSPCYCTVTVCNPGTTTYPERPVFVILDVYGLYLFAPDFSSFNYYSRVIAPGVITIDVLPEFTWPNGAGAAENIRFYAAMTDPSISELFGAMDVFTFGWH